MKVCYRKERCGGGRVDKIDELIIAALKDDSRVSLAQLARQVHKSRTAVESRVQKLIEKGVILGFTINVAEGDGTLQAAFLMLTLNGSHCHLVYPMLQQFSQVVHAYSLFGDVDMMLDVRYRSFEELMVFKESLLKIEHVKEVVVNPVLKAWR
jgi:DNA-binding Lrp family transcriptional regulator|nr:MULTISPECIES: Lrp/AsnC family transcriptional regulator [Pseudomonas]